MSTVAPHERLRSLAQYALLETTVDGIALIDADQRVVFVNRKLAGMLGEDVTGCPSPELVAAESRSAFAAALAERGSCPVVVLEVPLRRRPGGAVWARLALTPLFDAASAYVGALAVMTDVTERRRSEQALRTIAETSRALAGELDMQAIAAAVARSIGGGALVGLLEGPDSVAMRAYATTEPRAEGPLRALVGRVMPLLPGTVGEEVIRTARPVRMDGDGASRLQPPFATLARELGLGSLVVAPLLVHGRATGLLSVFRPAELDPLMAEDVPLVRELADRAAMAIERARLFEEQRRYGERLRLLADAGTSMGQSLDVGAALAAFARLTVSSFAQACAVELFEKGKVSCDAVAARDPGLEEATRRALGPYTGANVATDELRHVFEEGRARLLGPVDEHVLRRLAVDGTHYESLRALGIRSMIVVPLVARGVTLGIVSLARVEDPAYGDDDLTFAQELGRRAALAIDNARLFRSATEAIAVRDEFLSIASHELNTPLTPLKMQIDSLRRGKFPPERTAEKLEAASRQVTRLAKLVSELLDVSRIRVGKLQLEPEPLDFAALVDEVVARTADEAERAGSTLSVRSERPCTGTWDRTRLDQVVTNLLSNAIKYGGGKPIEIALGCTEKGVRFVVCDHGIGIAPEHQTRIFERFERAASPRHYGGFGLGLWITRQIVEASGGTIAVESSPGHGSKFVVELPR